MAKLTVIIGLAGSGKTHLCRELASSPNLAFPDMAAVRGEQRIGPRGLGELVARLLRGEDCVADAAHLVHRTNQETFRSFCEKFLGEVELNWIYFEPDLAACVSNIFRHSDPNHIRVGRLNALIKQVDVYQLPNKNWGEFEVRPVYQGDMPQFTDHKTARKFVEDYLDKHQDRKEEKRGTGKGFRAWCRVRFRQ